MTDRAQFTTPRLVPGLFVAVAVLVVVAAEVRDHVAAVDGPVEYCGLCHVDWRVWIAGVLLGLPLGMLVVSYIRSRRWA